MLILALKGGVDKKVLAKTVNGVYKVKQKITEETENQDKIGFFEELDLIDFRDDLRYK